VFSLPVDKLNPKVTKTFRKAIKLNPDPELENGRAPKDLQS
jgi:hypothetical protein